MSGNNKSKWSGRTDGSPMMQRGLVLLFKCINVHLLYFIMGWVIPFYMLFNRQGYLSSYNYFRRRHDNSPLHAFCNVYRHHFRFGQIILDRFAVYAGKQYRFRIDGVEHFNVLSEAQEGFVMLSSHVGNYELAGYHLASKHKCIYPLVFDGETETVMENRRRMFADKNVIMIPARADMSHVFALNNALSEGNIVSMPGDRIFGSSRHVECDFLGAKALFPLGPFAMAAGRSLPALAIFVMKEDTYSYTIYVRRINSPANDTNVHSKAESMAREFVNHLEHIVRAYPTQWFNFYDFWE